MTTYGTAPQLLGHFDLTATFTEYMHWMYLPVAIKEPGEPVQFSLPSQLKFATPLLSAALDNEMERGDRHKYRYIYLTTRRGYATPGNPLNRPGWHSDGFGTDDVNYVWTDRFPTLFAEGEFLDISNDHLFSAQQFERQIEFRRAGVLDLKTYGDGEFMRLDPCVIHAAPEIPAPGGERSFVKVSFSNDRYDLLGNAHNHGLDYDWPMHERAVTRNDPASAGRDFGHTPLGSAQA
ncbi:hypothetical protein B7R22_16960 [Subtercola boreus]|uniref:Phytanoyl-CoA dioxygenase n=1 Tax=Subtercola boreus TaxID=120213 RepID=A0A3E0VQZ3_9MICO|nr:hypothetical protein [Subtercola boreus]RFA12121.1 hypothetical protein B7R22_16960 [Subtercola boreus]